MLNTEKVVATNNKRQEISKPTAFVYKTSILLRRRRIIKIKKINNKHSHCLISIDEYANDDKIELFNLQCANCQLHMETQSIFGMQNFFNVIYSCLFPLQKRIHCVNCVMNLNICQQSRLLFNLKKLKREVVVKSFKLFLGFHKIKITNMSEHSGLSVAGTHVVHTATPS